MAQKVSSEASTSSTESARELNIETESVACHAQTLPTTRLQATSTEA